MTYYIKCALCGVFQEAQDRQGTWDIIDEKEFEVWNFCTGCTPHMTTILLNLHDTNKKQKGKSRDTNAKP